MVRRDTKIWPRCQDIAQYDRGPLHHGRDYQYTTFDIWHMYARKHTTWKWVKAHKAHCLKAEDFLRQAKCTEAKRKAEHVLPHPDREQSTGRPTTNRHKAARLLPHGRPLVDTLIENNVTHHLKLCHTSSTTMSHHHLLTLSSKTMLHCHVILCHKHYVMWVSCHKLCESII